MTNDQRSRQPCEDRSRRALKALAVLVFASAPAALQAQPASVTVEMSNFKFTPAQLDLKANTSVLLLLRNDSSGGHSFTAPQFFAASKLDPASAALVHSGRVEVPAHGAVQLSVTPVAGTYPLKCSHFLHSSMGMTGTIAVR